MKEQTGAAETEPLIFVLFVSFNSAFIAGVHS